MPTAAKDAGEQDRIARIEGMHETYMAEHTRLHEDTLALVTRVEARSYDLGERLANEQRDLTRALARVEGTLRAWRGVFVGLLAIAAGLMGAFIGPIVADFLSRAG